MIQSLQILLAVALVGLLFLLTMRADGRPRFAPARAARRPRLPRSQDRLSARR